MICRKSHQTQQVEVIIIIIEITHNIQLLHIGVTLEYQVTTSILRLQEPSSKFLLFPVALISGFAMPLLEFQFPSNCLLTELVSFPARGENTGGVWGV